MSLPKVDQPLFEMKIPSNNKVVKFRPFLVKEEKLLLIAQQSESDRDILRAIKQVLNNCIVDKIEIDDLATFDLEYMFLKLRAKSVNNIAKLSYRDNEDDEVYEFEVDLDEIEITTKEQNNKIKINDNMGIVMKYPAAAITEQMTEFENEIDLLMFFVKKCIDTIYDEDTVYPASEASEAELEAFIDSLNLDTFQKIREFFDAMPQLYHKMEYTNKMGNERIIELNNLRDFFMWR
jgi:hypothetical protein